MIWTTEQIDKLREHWDAGLSATLIAARLGGPSRCAVLGKAHRLGLAHRRTIKCAEYMRKPPGKRASRAKAAVAARAIARAAKQFNVQRVQKPQVRKLPPAEMTKNELRAMLKQAVINTAGMQ